MNTFVFRLAQKTMHVAGAEKAYVAERKRFRAVVKTVQNFAARDIKNLVKIVGMIISVPVAGKLNQRVFFVRVKQNVSR